MPRMLIFASWSGCATDTRTSACAARWKQTVGFTPAKSFSCGSRMSPSTKLRALGHVLALAAREVVEHDDVVAARDQERLCDVRADEPRSSGDENRHARILGACSSPSRAWTARARPPRPSSCGRTSKSWAAMWSARASPAAPSSGEKVRDLLLGGTQISPWAEAGLFAAARAELVVRGDRPGARARGRRRLRPLPRLVARVPGDRARPRRRSRARAEHRRDPRHPARRDVPPARRPGGGGPALGLWPPTASSGRARSSCAPSTRPTAS